MLEKRALIVMAKRPAAGNTKTRLSPPLSLEDSAELYNNFLHDLIPKLAQLDGISPIIAHPEDPLAPAYFQQLAPTVPTILQQGDTLGDRLDHVIRHCFDAGYAQVAAINSDSPTLPASYYASAFTCLNNPNTDAVFGPCFDGGYYLIGLKQPHPPLVREVQMSTPDVLRDTLAIAQRLQLNVEQLPPWYDVDDAETLQKLRHDLAEHPEWAPQTLQFLQTLKI